MDIFFIPPEKIHEGINRAIQYSVLLLEASWDLFDNKKFQQSIPLAILAYEEAAKASLLLRNLQEKRGMSKEEWMHIRNHKFKLTELENVNLDMIRNMSKAEAKFFVDSQKGILEKPLEESKEQAISNREKILNILSKLEKVKEICFYSNWNAGVKKWESFQSIPKPDQQAINYFINTHAENLQVRVIFNKDMYENPPKKIGIKDVIPDVEKNEILVIDDVEKIENRESFKQFKQHFELCEKYNDLRARGLFLLENNF